MSDEQRAIEPDPEDAAQVARISDLFEQANAATRRSQYDAAASLLNRADQALLRLNPQAQAYNLLRAQGFWLHGRISYGRDQTYNAEDDLSQALALLGDAAADQSLRINIYNLLGNINYIRNDEAQAVVYFEQAATLARQQGNHTRAAVVLSNLGAMLSVVGRSAVALDYCQQATAEADLSNDPYAIATAYRSLATYYSIYGPITEAERAVQRTLAVAPTVGDVNMHLMLLAQAAELNTLLDNHAAATSLLREGQALARQAEDTVAQQLLDFSLAGLATAQDDYYAAIGHTLRILNSTNTSTLIRIRAASELVELYIKLADWANARRYLQWLRNHIEADDGVHRARLALCQARLHAALGEYAEADAAFKEGLTNPRLAKQAQAGGWADYARMLRGWAAAGNAAADPTAAAAQAAELYRQLGLPQQVAALEAR